MNEQKSAFDIEQMEKHDKIELVYQHDDNDISVIFTTNHVKPDLLNFVNSKCTETLHIYDICGGGIDSEKMRVSFEF